MRNLQTNRELSLVVDGFQESSVKRKHQYHSPAHSILRQCQTNKNVPRFISALSKWGHPHMVKGRKSGFIPRKYKWLKPEFLPLLLWHCYLQEVFKRPALMNSRSSKWSPGALEQGSHVNQIMKNIGNCIMAQWEANGCADRDTNVSPLMMSL